MKSYIECCDEVGYDRLSSPPTKEYIYYAYKDGVCTQCTDEAAAKKISKLVERKVTNQSVINRYSYERSIKYQKAFDLWYSGLKEDYNHISDNLFNLIYSQAYEDGHSSGYDSVADHFNELYNFAHEVLKIGG